MFYLITRKSLQDVRVHLSHCLEFRNKYPLEVAQIIHGQKIYRYPRYAFEQYGYDFGSIDPFRLLWVKGKSNVINSLTIDLSALSFCYNSPLSIIVSTDRAMYKFFPDGYSSINNSSLKKINQLESGDTSVFLPRETQFLNGNHNLLKEQVQTGLRALNMKPFPVWEFRLDHSGFQIVDRRSSIV